MKKREPQAPPRPAKVRLQRVFAGTVRRQLILGIALVHLLLMTVFVLDLTRRQAEFTQLQQFERSTELARMLALTSRSWVLARDVAGLREVVATVGGDSGVRYVMVLDPQGRVLAHSSPDTVGSYVADPVSLGLLSAPPTLQRLVADEVLIDVAAPIVGERGTLGWARVALDLREHRASLQETEMNGLLYTLSAILLGSLFAALMARHLTRGLQGLVDASRGLARGERVDFSPSGRHDEIGLLAQSFQEMAHTIAEREQSLQESEFRFRTLFEQSPDPAWIDDGKQLLECSPAAAEALGYASRAELLAQPLAGLFAAGQRVETAAWHGEPDPVARGEPGVHRFEWSFLRADGKTFPAEVTRARINLQGNDAFYSTVRDISARKRDEASLRLAASVFHNTLDGILIAEAEGELVSVVSINPAFTRITGYSSGEIVGKNPRFLRSGRHDPAFYASLWDVLLMEGTWQGEIWNRRKNGELFLARQTITRIDSERPGISRYISVFGDITEIHLRDSHIQHLAFHDALTGLPNRVLLYDRLEQSIAAANREASTVAVLFLDLDRFKAVNDRLGHKCGDELLQEVALRLRSVLREVDTLSRQGGDEFVIVLQHPLNEEDVHQVAERIIETVGQPVQLGEAVAQVGVSIGIAFYPAHGRDGMALVKNADMAMYAAKNAGRDTYRVFDPAMAGDSDEFRGSGASRDSGDSFSGDTQAGAPTGRQAAVDTPG